jgi:hypothetical protein
MRPAEPARSNGVMRSLLFPRWWQAWLILAVLAADAPMDAAGAGVRMQVEAVARELVAGVAAGDWAPWERHASDALLYTSELGRTLTKQELKSVFGRRHPEQQRTLNMDVVGFQSRGETAVLALELQAREADGVERYRVTQIYWRIGRHWRLAASHACGVAEDLDQRSVEGSVR